MKATSSAQSTTLPEQNLDALRGERGVDIGTIVRKTQGGPAPPRRH
jgi:hypothetical protein